MVAVVEDKYEDKAAARGLLHQIASNNIENLLQYFIEISVLPIYFMLQLAVLQ